MGIGLVLLGATAWAQGTPQSEPAAANGLVTGHVSCADTQRAARFAQVELIPASSESGGEIPYRGRGGRGLARTDLDGNFSIPNVGPGDYFLVGQLSGYVNQRDAVDTALSAGKDPAATLPGVPEVHVGAGGGNADLLLQRGGVLAGTVQWDDGTPAGGIQVSVQAAPASGTAAATTGQATAPPPPGNAFVGFSGGQTDDRGRFRISGLATGVYVVRATMQAPTPQGGAAPPGRFTRTLTLGVYAPATPRRTDAAAVKLAAGEERDDVAITLGLGALHSIAGVVSSPGAAVRSGTVTVVDQTDASLNRTGVINGDGSFVVPYVPPGSYTMRVSASSSAAGGYGRGGYGQGSGGAGASFQPLQESVTVTNSDLTGVNVNITAAVSSP